MKQQEAELMKQQAKVKEQVEAELSFRSSAHPFACVFTFAFKIAAFLMYGWIYFRYFIIGNFFTEVNTFIIVVLLSAVDFWTVKNVTGRLLVGLRWWNDFDHNGRQVWKFDSYNKDFKANAYDSSIFWTSQIAATITWAVFLVLKILSFSIFWSVLCLINLTLAATNLLGYYKCKGEHNKKINNLKNEMMAKGIKTFFSGK